MARIGGEMQLGTRSSLLGEIHYNHCKVKGNADKKAGLPVWDEVDMSCIKGHGVIAQRVGVP